MANAGADDNGSQFFFTLDRADELNKKHTIFGKVDLLFWWETPQKNFYSNFKGLLFPLIKPPLFSYSIISCCRYFFLFLIQVTGNTIYNMIRFNDLDISDADDRPYAPPKIIKTEVDLTNNVYSWLCF